ncbi:hypothetical protein [Mycoplasma seminis]|uniref:DUF4231 domain-containing protein n=1 Tax=Mycoplasma seminis TaxID=512749 RepID=A0ABY9HBM6_9MOLU|nr:hypothetical protein [Mycoplasma seminis]WLP85589.1 hypothetical protein Q8852_00220 [Mycoplasma seminis]
MELTETTKYKLVNNLDDLINKMNNKRKGEFNIINILKKKAFFIFNYILLPMFAFLILIIAVAVFIFEQMGDGIRFANKIIGAYTDTQIFCIIFMVIGSLLLVSLIVESALLGSKIKKLQTSFIELIENNKSLKFYSQVDMNIKKIFDATSTDFSSHIIKANFWDKLDKDFSQTIEALDRIKNKMILDPDNFIEEITAKVGEPAVKIFINSF